MASGSSGIEVITDTARCQQVVDQLLVSSQPIAVDAEGERLGPDGPLTLLQVMTWDGDVYLFDVKQNRDLIVKGRLKQVLESTTLLKVIHGCHSDSAALHFQFDVKLTNVFDTQAACLTLQKEVEGVKFPKFLKLEDLVTKYGGTVPTAKDLKNEWKYKADFWAKRPLTKEMIEYAAGDVRMLIPTVYNNMNSLIKKHNLSAAMALHVDEMLYERIEPERIKTQKNQRKQETAREVVREMETKWRHSIPRVTQLEEHEKHALWILDLTELNTDLLRRARQALEEDLLAKYESALQDPKTMFKKLENIDEVHLKQVASEGTPNLLGRAKQTIDKVDVERVKKALWKVKKELDLASREKFLIFQISPHLTSNLSQLESARYYVAAQLLRDILPKLSRSSDDVNKLTSTEQELLVVIPVMYMRDSTARRARETLLTKKSTR